MGWLVKEGLYASNSGSPSKTQFFSSLGAETSLSRLVFSIVFISLLIPLSSEAATYYTKKTGSDSNSCAAAQNASTSKLTIIAGKNCLTTPGDTLIVGDGTYVEAEIAMSVSGTQANPITIRAENTLQAILSSISSCNPNISLYADWVTIDGIRSQVNAADVQCPSGRSSASGAFVRIWHNNSGGTVKNCQVDASSHRGIGIKSNSDNTLVENCVMHSSLEGMSGANQVFRNNYIDTPDIWGDYFTSKGGSRNTQFYNNVIRKSSGSRGLTLGGNSGNQFLYDPPSGIECYNCVAYNNVVIVDSGTGTYAVTMQGCVNCALFNNVIVGGAIHFGTGGNPDGLPQVSSSSPIIQNNIFYCNGINHQSGTSIGTLTRDYNNYFNCSGTATQAHPITGDPQFVDPQSDWRLNPGSPAIGSGVQVSFTGFGGQAIDVSRDKVAVTRTAPWSLGLYAGTTTTTNTPPASPSGISVQ